MKVEANKVVAFHYTVSDGGDGAGRVLARARRAARVPGRPWRADSGPGESAARAARPASVSKSASRRPRLRRAPRRISRSACRRSISSDADSLQARHDHRAAARSEGGAAHGRRCRRSASSVIDVDLNHPLAGKTLDVRRRDHRRARRDGGRDRASACARRGRARALIARDSVSRKAGTPNCVAPDPAEAAGSSAPPNPASSIPNPPPSKHPLAVHEMLAPPGAVDAVQAHGAAAVGCVHEAALADVDADVADAAVFGEEDQIARLQSNPRPVCAGRGRSFGSRCAAARRRPHRGTRSRPDRCNRSRPAACCRRSDTACRPARSRGTARHWRHRRAACRPPRGRLERRGTLPQAVSTRASAHGRRKRRRFSPLHARRPAADCQFCTAWRCGRRDRLRRRCHKVTILDAGRLPGAPLAARPRTAHPDPRGRVRNARAGHARRWRRRPARCRHRAGRAPARVVVRRRPDPARPRPAHRPGPPATSSWGRAAPAAVGCVETFMGLTRVSGLAGTLQV